MTKKLKHNGRTVHQQVDTMLRLMSPNTARNAASRHENATSDVSTAEWWSDVNALLGKLVHGHITNSAILEQATKDANAMPHKQSKRQPIPKLTADPIAPLAWNGLCSQGEHKLDREGQACIECDQVEALEKVADLVRSFERKLKDVNATLAAFTEGMKTDPRRALEWADTTFKAAARLSVFAHVIATLTDDNGKPVVTKTTDEERGGIKTTRIWHTMAWVREYAQKEVNRRAQQGSRSTSTCSNLMDDQVLVAWADVLEILSWG